MAERAAADDHYTFLGLEPSAAAEKIEAAIQRQMKRASALALTDPRASHALRERLRAIREDLLTDRPTRDAYDATLRPGQDQNAVKQRARRPKPTASAGRGATTVAWPPLVTELQEVVTEFVTTMAWYDRELQESEERLIGEGSTSEAELNDQLRRAGDQLDHVLQTNEAARLLLTGIPGGLATRQRAAGPDQVDRSLDPMEQLRGCATAADAAGQEIRQLAGNPLVKLSVGQGWAVAGSLALFGVLLIALTSTTSAGSAVVGILVLAGAIALVAFQASYRERLAGCAGRLTRAVDDARRLHGEIESGVTARRRQLLSAGPAIEQTRAAIERRRAEAARRLERASTAIVRQAGAAALPWDAPDWATWLPDGRAIPIARIGQVRLSSGGATLLMPALLRVPGSRGLAIQGPEATERGAIEAVQVFTLRLLAVQPPGRFELRFIDSLGLGQHAGPFMHLDDYRPGLAGGRVWSDPDHIRHCLAELAEHIKRVGSLCAEAGCPSLEEYQARHPEAAGLYRVLVVMGYPRNFTPTSLAQLVMIARQGPACGTSLIMTVNTDLVARSGLSLTEVAPALDMLEWNGRAYGWRDNPYKEGTVELDGPPPYQRFNDLIERIGQAAEPREPDDARSPV